MSTLPILLSIPHCGMRTPPEITERVAVSHRDIFDDADPYTDKIYGLADAIVTLTADVARAFVDLNRAPRDMAPTNPDGLIKSATCYDRLVYKPGMEPDRKLRQILIGKYYMPYHSRLRRAVADPKARLCLDCHSMPAHAPPISRGKPIGVRPTFCISTRNGATCPPQMAEALADCIAESFHVGRDEVRIDEPFVGGYITKKYGRGQLPCIQIEMNRSLYLSKPWFKQEDLTVACDRLDDLNCMFRSAMANFVKVYNWST